MFPPGLWNVRGVTINRGRLANNISEAWGNAILSLVGRKRPIVWKAIDGPRKDTAYDKEVATHEAHRQRHPKKLKRALVEFQNRARDLCEDHQDGRGGLGDFARGVARSTNA